MILCNFFSATSHSRRFLCFLPLHVGVNSSNCRLFSYTLNAPFFFPLVHALMPRYTAVSRATHANSPYTWLDRTVQILDMIVLSWFSLGVSRAFVFLYLFRRASQFFVTFTHIRHRKWGGWPGWLRRFIKEFPHPPLQQPWIQGFARLVCECSTHAPSGSGATHHVITYHY